LGSLQPKGRFFAFEIGFDPASPEATQG